MVKTSRHHSWGQTASCSNGQGALTGGIPHDAAVTQAPRFCYRYLTASPHKPEERNKKKRNARNSKLINFRRLNKVFKINLIKHMSTELSHWEVCQLLQLANMNNSVIRVCRHNVVTPAQENFSIICIKHLVRR